MEKSAMPVREYSGSASKKVSGSAAKKVHLKILYVEDEDVNWEIAELRLRDHFDLSRAKNAREVFSLLASNQFNLILMDIQLADSDLNGIEITETLKGKKGRKLPDYAKNLSLADMPPIVFITAYSARYSKEELASSGSADLLTKPVDFVYLCLAMTKIIAQHSLQVLNSKSISRNEPR